MSRTFRGCHYFANACISSCLRKTTDFTVKILYSIFTVDIYSGCFGKNTDVTVKQLYSTLTVKIYSSYSGRITNFTVKTLYSTLTVKIYSSYSGRITNFTVKTLYSTLTVKIYSQISCKKTEIFNSVHPQLYMLATALPPRPLANISGKHFLGALFILKVPLETRAPPPQLFEAPVIIYCLNCIRRDQNSTYKMGLTIFALTNTYKSSLALPTSAELLLISVPSFQT